MTIKAMISDHLQQIGRSVDDNAVTNTLVTLLAKIRNDAVAGSPLEREFHSLFSNHVPPDQKFAPKVIQGQAVKMLIGTEVDEIRNKVIVSLAEGITRNEYDLINLPSIRECLLGAINQWEVKV